MPPGVNPTAVKYININNNTLCTAQLIHIDFITPVTRSKEYELQRSSVRSSLHTSGIASLLSPSTLLRTLFSHTLNLCSSLRVTEQVQTSQLQSAVVGGNSWSRVINIVPCTFRQSLCTNSRSQTRSDITRYFSELLLSSSLYDTLRSGAAKPLKFSYPVFHNLRITDTRYSYVTYPF